MCETARWNSLVDAARQGDRRAYELIYRELSARLYHYAASLVGDAATAEDITQGAFVKAWESLPKLKSSEAFIVWIHRIARNLAVDSGRLAAREEPAGSGSEPEWETEDPRRGGRPEAAVLDQERNAVVHRAVAALPDHQREVVVLHHFGGMPVEDVARTIGVPTGTVLSRLARAREALRRRIYWLGGDMA